VDEEATSVRFARAVSSKTELLLLLLMLVLLVVVLVLSSLVEVVVVVVAVVEVVVVVVVVSGRLSLLNVDVGIPNAEIVIWRGACGGALSRDFSF
jgi:hypothetical protein